MKLPKKPPKEKKSKVEKPAPMALIVKGSFRGQRAEILRDYGFHARLHIPGMALNLHESFYSKLV